LIRQTLSRVTILAARSAVAQKGMPRIPRLRVAYEISQHVVDSARCFVDTRNRAIRSSDNAEVATIPRASRPGRVPDQDGSHLRALEILPLTARRKQKVYGKRTQDSYRYIAHDRFRCGCS
jgi:hypothetical protein